MENAVFVSAGTHILSWGLGRQGRVKHLAHVGVGSEAGTQRLEPQRA